MNRTEPGSAELRVADFSTDAQLMQYVRTLLSSTELLTVRDCLSRHRRQLHDAEESHLDYLIALHCA